MKDTIPEIDIKDDIIKKEFSDVSKHQKDLYSTGMRSGAVYHSENVVLNESIQSSMEEFCFNDASNSQQYKGMAHMEADILKSTLRLFNGDSDSYALATSGGTESIISAIAAYKFWAKKEKGITKPNLVYFSSAHAAFIKGCSYMDIEPREIPTDENGVAIPSKLHKYIDSNTIAVVWTACTYAHGTIDNVKEIASIAADYNVGCHVDNCLGGFVNCFIEYLYDEVLPFDFRNRGVTSISADTHKYGYGPKGMSVLMLRPKKLFDYLMYTSVEHSGAPFTVRNLGSNRSGSVIAGTWTAMMKNGLRGYISKVQRIHNSTKQIRKEIKRMTDLRLYSPNNSYNMVCFDGITVNPISVSSKIRETKGWHLNELMLPPVVHLLVMESNLNKLDQFVPDLKEAVEHVKSKEKIRTYSYQAFYGAVINITDEGIMDVIVGSVLDWEFETSKESAMRILDG